MIDQQSELRCCLTSSHCIDGWMDDQVGSRVTAFDYSYEIDFSNFQCDGDPSIQ